MSDIIPLNLKSLSPNSEFIIATNLKNEVSILGVAKGEIRDSKLDNWRKSYLVFYQISGVKKKAEINLELYNALHLVFDTILDIEHSPIVG